MTRRITLISHPERQDAAQTADVVAQHLTELGFAVETETAVDAAVGGASHAVAGSELILVIGGDGTILRAAELGRPAGVPILGINYGHVGFLSEADPDDIPQVIQNIVDGNWLINERMTIDVSVKLPDGTEHRNWALNETAIEKDPNAQMIEASIGVDGRELSSFKVDTVVCSTATGSTAYNFSAGGPVVWPNVDCMVMTPIAAHALFTRPLVVGPDSTLELHVLEDNARVWCDGRRMIEAPCGSVIRIVRGAAPVKLARLNDSPFSGRLVTKFQLPVKGWRANGTGAPNGEDKRLDAVEK
ncbi:MAG: NAD kinase [Ancrocorticia sp.]|uniref:NAD kinase n=1 Tax=Ancrocorticia sp. TaxID=2593684 RepID=UPI003F939AF3